MIVTPKMWSIKKRIEFLAWQSKCDPGDYLVIFELEEMRHKYALLERVEKLGLKVLNGGQASNSSTNSAA